MYHRRLMLFYFQLQLIESGTCHLIVSVAHDEGRLSLSVRYPYQSALEGPSLINACLSYDCENGESWMSNKLSRARCRRCAARMDAHSTRYDTKQPLSNTHRCLAASEQRTPLERALVELTCHASTRIQATMLPIRCHMSPISKSYWSFPGHKNIFMKCSYIQHS